MSREEKIEELEKRVERAERDIMRLWIMNKKRAESGNDLMNELIEQMNDLIERSEKQEELLDDLEEMMKEQKEMSKKLKDKTDVDVEDVREKIFKKSEGSY